MFGKKKQVQMDLKMEAGYYRLVVDYFDSKDKDKVREILYACMIEVFDTMLLQADSNFINKKWDGKEGPWMEALIQWGKALEMPVETFVFKRQVSASILGSMLGSKVTQPGYRVGILLKPQHLHEAVNRHGEMDMGVHLGCGIMEEAQAEILKDYCGGLLDEFNFEKYYCVDFYDHNMISRCVMKSLMPEPLEKIRKALEARLE